jgi:hypothetical protein
MPLLNPLPELGARELTRDDGHGHAVSALVGQLLRVARDMLGRRDRALAEGRAQPFVEVDEVLILEQQGSDIPGTMPSPAPGAIFGSGGPPAGPGLAYFARYG